MIYVNHVLNQAKRIFEKVGVLFQFKSQSKEAYILNNGFNTLR